MDDARSAARLRAAREEIRTLAAMTDTQMRLTDYADCAG